MIPIHPAKAYIADVLSGKQVASSLVKKTIERHERDLRNANARGLIFSEAKAQRVIDFFGFLNHSKGEWAGQQFELQPWQQCLIWILFGWAHKDTGFRRFRFAYNELARGNGKSTLASGIALYMLIADGEPGAEVYSAATKKAQAKLCFDEAVRMVKQSAHLSNRITSYRDNLHIQNTASKYEPLSSDEDSLDGLNPHCCVIDELHAHPTRKVWDVLVTALGKRRQPLLFAITTAGYDRHSVCWEQHSYSEKVLSGIIEDDTWFAWIAALDIDNDWADESNWIKANPGIGTTVSLSELQQAANKAKASPGELNSFLRLRLNVWTTQHTAWMPMDAWDACSGEIDITKLQGRPCFGGLDLSTTTDVAAFVLLFPPTFDDELWRVLPFLFLPKDNIEQRVKKDRVPYDVWHRQGHFNLTDGNVIDYDVIRSAIVEQSKLYNIREIAFDRWNAQQIVTQLQGDGLAMIEFGQGFADMQGPTKRLLELVLSEDLAHGNHPVLRWMASNVTVKTDPAGNLKPDKSKSSEKIDGIVALIMALGRASLAPMPKKTAAFKPFLL